MEQQKKLDYINDNNDVEINTFIKENIHLKRDCSIEAFNTYYLADYKRLKESKIPTKNFYSYAMREYFVKEPIPIDKILAICIDSNHYRGDLEKTIQEIQKIIDYYHVNIPLEITGYRGISLSKIKSLFSYYNLSSNRSFLWNRFYIRNPFTTVFIQVVMNCFFSNS